MPFGGMRRREMSATGSGRCGSNQVARGGSGGTVEESPSFERLREGDRYGILRWLVKRREAAGEWERWVEADSCEMRGLVMAEGPTPMSPAMGEGPVPMSFTRALIFLLGLDQLLILDAGLTWLLLLLLL